jgi:ribosomal protein L1
VGGEELCAQVLSGEIQPTKVICTPSLLSTITPKVGRFLGPKGLMPNPKRGTVREDMDVAVQEAKGLMDWREDRQGHVRAGGFLRPLANCSNCRGSRLIITLLL